ncbi:MAG: alpha-glucan family phosphorylase [Elusimicrobia bacterium]|nr:alpha-glucan family phosphorylase [Elusimicrobiota bacterium]
MKIHSFSVAPNLPENLKALDEISQNMWFTWNWEAIMMLVSMDEELWHRSHRNPRWVLGNLPSERLAELSKNQEFVNNLANVKKLFDDYLSRKTWFDETRKPEESDFLAAYFSMEFGIGEGLPIYSGGLGMLSGDHLKTASDIGLPLVGVGLLYQKGYIQQALTRDGWQVERYPENDWANMPVQMVKNSDGGHLVVEVPLGLEIIKVSVWRVPVGRTSLFLLDTNLPENPPHHRLITEQLYGGDRDNRIRQEIVLGLGGVKALEAMGLKPTVYHINEGHSAFLLFERIRMLMQSKKISFNEAREAVWASSVFTTHTPVMAGNEHFEFELVRKYFEPFSKQLGISWDEFLAIGKEDPASPTFCMTAVALRLSAFINGVSKLNGEVARKIWQKVWPRLPFDEIPIHSITNGVHIPSWISHEHNNLYKKYLDGQSSDARDWKKTDSIPDEELWQVHKERKNKLVNLVRSRMGRQLLRMGSDVTVLEEAKKILNPDVLTIGFARRFATYKRATLIFKNIDRLVEILNNPKMPVQLIFAGKAHQADVAGKELVKFIVRLMSDARFKNKLVFVEDYNMNVARYFTQGVDVWLNNPARPLEASGTSGMKAAVNGVLNFSVLDGWWCEAYSPQVGWALGGSELYNDDAERDYVESEAIYNLIQKEIAPLYYDRDERGVPRKWLSRMKSSIKNISPQFCTHRMVREYYERFYVPAHRHGKNMLSDGIVRDIAAWRKKILESWPKVRVIGDSVKVERQIAAGQKILVKAKVWLGNLSPQDVSVEMYVGKVDLRGEISGGKIIPLNHESQSGDEHSYAGEISADISGRHDFSVRVMPKNSNIPHPYTPALIKWEE